MTVLAIQHSDAMIYVEDPISTGPQVVARKVAKVSWTHNELNPPSLLVGFEIVLYTGADPSDIPNRVAGPVTAGAADRSTEITFAPLADFNLNAAVRSCYADGSHSPWRNIPGEVYVQAQVWNVLSDLTLDEIDGNNVLIRLHRMPKADLPFSAPYGEMYLTADTAELYVGDPSGTLVPIRLDASNIIGGTVTGDLHYHHTQATASDTWDITHGMGKRPSATITDDAGFEIGARVEHVDATRLIAHLSEPATGHAYLN